jgi:hypothetical protein
LHSSVLERTESDLSKINWLYGVILLHFNSVGALGQVFIVSHSYQTYFGFPRSDLNLDCGLRDHKVASTPHVLPSLLARFGCFWVIPEWSDFF